MPNAKELVELGVEELDHIMPNWYSLVDLTRLDLEEPLQCVLGQLEPHLPIIAPSSSVEDELAEEYNDAFDRALIKLDWSGDNSREYGFNRWGWDDPTWSELTQEWKRVISNKIRRNLNAWE